MRFRTDGLKHNAPSVGADFANFVAGQSKAAASAESQAEPDTSVAERQDLLQVMNSKSVRYAIGGFAMAALLLMGISLNTSTGNYNSSDSGRTPIIHQVTETEVSMQPVGEDFSIIEKMFCRGHSKSWICS